MTNDNPEQFDQLSAKEKRTLLRKLLSEKEKKRYPLSALQEQIWLEEQQKPATARYHISLVYHMQGVLNDAAFLQALQDLTQRHAMLRLSLIEEAGHTWQQVNPAVIDFKTLSINDQSATATKKTLQEIALEPFNLLQSVLWRVRVIRVATDAHYVLFVFHHLIFDGLSQDVLERDLRELYAAACNSTPVALPALVDDYGRFALEQSRFLQTKESQQQIRYWQTALEKVSKASPLPFDNTKSIASEIQSTQYSQLVQAELIEGCSAIATSNNTSLHLVLLAIFECLLWRYSQQNTFIIASVFSQRPVWAENLIGMFVNTLPLPAIINVDDNFLILLARLRESAFEAYQNGDLPFSQIVAHTGEYKAGDAKLVRTMFTLEPRSVQRWTWHDNLSVHYQGLLDTATSKFDLSLFIRQQEENWFAVWEFDTDIYHLETIQQLQQSFQILLAAIVNDPHARLNQLPIMNPIERQRLLMPPIQAVPLLTENITFIEVFARRVQETPQAIALQDIDGEITYQELDEQSNQMAQFLLEKGVQADEIVAILLPHRLQTVVTILGILKTGAAYLPLDMSYPDQRLAFMLADSKSLFLLTLQDGFSTRDFQIQTDVIFLDDDKIIQQIRHQSVETLPSLPNAHDLAYIIYTSGSTGSPKGVLIEHRQLMHYLQWCLDNYFNTPPASVPLFTSLAFDLTITGLFGTLLAGHTIWLIESENVVDWVLALQKEQSKISLLKLTPSHLDILNQLEGHKALAKRISVLIVGGEALNAQHVLPFLESNPDLVVINEYGPTEATVGCCIYRIGGQQIIDGNIPIGKAIDRTQFYVLDQYLEPVPVGVKGELYIAGSGLARGYLRREDETAARFIDNPFYAGRLYKTGDIARYLHTGQLEYLGRNDAQIKRLGYRIELGEIEHILLAQAEVRQAAVIFNPIDNDKGSELVAYYVADASINLYKRLATILTAPMLPDRMVRVEQLPLTENGKIDRSILSTLSDTETQNRTKYVNHVHNPIQDRIAVIWQQILGLSYLPSINDDFFRLGGNSLQIIQLRTSLYQAFGHDISLRDMFQQRTIASIAHLIENDIHVSSIPIVDASLPVPLSGMQEQIWLEEELNPGSANYHIPLSYDLHGTVDSEILKQALQDLSERQKILKSHLSQNSETISQSLASDFTLNFEFIKLDDVVTLSFVTETIIQQTFNLYQAPLWRVRLIKLHDSEYRLLFVFHHLIFDGHSQQILEQELAELYTARLNQKSASLPELKAQYSAFAIHQQQAVVTQNLEATRQYWRDKLLNLPADLALPYDHPAFKRQSQSGARFTQVVPSVLIDKSRAYAISEGTTLYNVWLAIFEVLLWRYSRHQQFLVGSVMSQRPSWASSLIGMFVNTLPLRAEMLPEMSFDELVRVVSQETLATYDYSNLSFPEIAAQRNQLGTNQTLLQVMFSVEEDILHNAAWGDIRVERNTIIDTHTNKFDLTLTIYQHGGDWFSSWEYDAGLFDERTIAQLSHHYEYILKNVLSDTASTLQAIPLLTELERQQILYDFNARYLPLPDGTTVISLFQVQAQATPNARVVSDKVTQLTYRELDERSNQLAHALCQKGVETENIVALLLPRRVDMLIAILAVMKAGAAYLPLDTDYPPKRIQFMLEDSASKLLLTRQDLYQQFNFDNENTTWFLDVESYENYPITAIDTLPHPSQLAYLIYTSGSTGIPKGVMIEHRNIINLITWHQHDYDLQTSDCAAIMSNFAFDGSVWDIFPYITMGASVHIPESDTRMDSERLFEMFRQYEISHVLLTTALFEHFLDDLENSHDLSLRYVFIGGEKLKKTPSKPLDFVAVNNYGPTENTVVTTTGPIINHLLQEIPTIGRPIPNVQVYILDDQMRPVPIGVVGEMYIGGKSIGRGYFNRPEKTAQSFVQSPFVDDVNVKLYRTGDLARYRENGQIDFVGRTDRQVKIRGHRIEIGELQHLLSQHPQIADCLVTVTNGEASTKSLIAYIISMDYTIISDNMISHYLRQSLPEYMLPTRYIYLKEFPLTPNGKINHDLLPDPEQGSHQQIVPPSNELEALLLTIWKDVLNQKNLSVNDHFFSRGGNSLLAGRIIVRVRNELQRQDLSIRIMFDYPILSDFAAYLQQQSDFTQTSEPYPIRPLPDVIPASLQQERIWFIEKLHQQQTSTIYNIPLLLVLRGKINIEALQKSYQSLFVRHEVLRTYFEMQDEHLIQIIRTDIDAQLVIEDLRQVANAREIATERESALIAYDFDLSQAPLMVAKLLRITDHETHLIINIHHSIADGWSLNILLADIEQSYTRYLQDEVFNNERLPLNYADYAIWQRSVEQKAIYNELIDYWKTELANIPESINLQLDYPKSTIQKFAGKRQAFEVDITLYHQIQLFCREMNVTTFMMMLAVTQSLIYRYTQQSDIVLGTSIANRPHLSLENIIGFFANTLIMRGEFTDETTFSDLLLATRQRAIQVYQHQELPFEQLVNELNPERNLSHNPLFQVLFVMQNTPALILDLPSLDVEIHQLDDHISRFDLSFAIQEKDTHLNLILEYRTDLFHDETIRRMGEHYLQILSAVMQYPKKPIKALSVISEAEWQIIQEWNSTTKAFPDKMCLHHFFEQQATQTPDQIALVFDGQSMSYQQLNEHANQVAHYLLSQGLVLEESVGIGMYRSFEMVIAMLAILKAGGAYIPLDPDYPIKRLQYMAENADLSLILSHQKAIDIFQTFSLPVINLEQDFAAYSNKNPNVILNSRNLAYIIYTSGSTGQPKGVMVEHQAIMNRLHWMQDYLQLTPDDRILQKTPYSFDVSVWEFFWPLMVGSTLVIAEPEEHKNPHYINEVIQKEQITTMHFVPSMLNAFLEIDVSACKSLKRVICSGEALSRVLVNRFFNQLDSGLYNLYGPTEATIDVSYWECQPNQAQLTVPIGYPIDNIQLYILDDNLTTVPIGIPGDLYIAGVGLSRGYVNNEDLTHERFLKNPFGNGRIYLTGDHARYLADGSIEFLGRRDFQVKLRGFRIELTEIEQKLMTHSAVQQAVVLLHNQQENANLVGYILSRDSTLQKADLFKFLEQLLPQHMIPSTFLIVDEMPLLTNGKVNRSQLMAIPVEYRTDPDKFVAPHTKNQRLLGRIWREVLGIEHVSIQDNFFRLGGHSLLANRMINRLRDATSVTVTLQAIFQNPTIEALANWMDQQNSVQSKVSKIKRVDRSQYLRKNR